MLALQHDVIPDHLTKVLAGVDREAARERMVGIAPSSPSVALFKDGRLVHMLERRHIERMTAQEVAGNLAVAFDQHCERKGPSVASEIFQKARAGQFPLYNPGNG